MPGLLEPAFRHQLVEWDGTQRKALGSTRIGSCAIGISAFQLQPLAQLAQQVCHLGSIQFGHAEAQPPRCPGGSRATRWPVS